MSVLDNIADIAYNALNGVFKEFTLIRKETVASSGKPWEVAETVNTEYACKAIKSDYKNYEIDDSRIQVGDCKIIILAKSVSIKPKTSDNIRDTDGHVWKVLAVHTDPASATYKCQCR